MIVTRRHLLFGSAGILAAAGVVAWRTTTHLKVEFYGLLGMAPSGDGTSFLLLSHDNHVPRLYAPIGAKAPDSIDESGTIGNQAFWNLANQQVTLISGSTGGTERNDQARAYAGDTNKDKPSNPSSQGDVSWVAQLSKISEAAGSHLKSGCVQEPDPSKLGVGCRVQFNGGKIHARFTHPKHQTVWQLGSSYKQALAELMLKQTIWANSVTFRLAPFDSPSTTSDIVLTPTTGANLEIEINNLPDPEADCTTNSEGNNLAHFAAYYALLDPPPASPPIPSCGQGGNCPGCPHEGEIIYCPPIDYGS